MRNFEADKLSEQVVGLLVDCYKDELESVYLAGSLRRGDFIPNKSDADYYVVVQSTHNDKERRGEISRHAQKLSDVWSGEGIVSVDITVIPRDQLSATTNSRTAFIIALDSDLIWGKRQDLGWVAARSSAQLAVVFNQRARRRLASIMRRNTEGRVAHKDMQRVKKIGLRCAYGVAMLRGASYNPDYHHYSKTVSNLVPELTDQVAILENGETLQDKLYAADAIIDFADQQGIPML
jgi:predicted nucleotidyltransferase